MEETKELRDLARKLKNQKSKEINKRYWLKKAKEKLAEKNNKKEG